MKGFIDRTFLPGITFQPINENSIPEKLLKGKTGRIIITADTPKWYDTLFMKSPAINQFKKGTLEFCGLSPVKVTYISPIKSLDINYRQDWLRKMSLLGEKLK
jgi:putative NADPH-quinone reductase